MIDKEIWYDCQWVSHPIGVKHKHLNVALKPSIIDPHPTANCESCLFSNKEPITHNCNSINQNNTHETKDKRTSIVNDVGQSS